MPPPGFEPEACSTKGCFEETATCTNFGGANWRSCPRFPGNGKKRQPKKSPGKASISPNRPVTSQISFPSWRLVPTELQVTVPTPVLSAAAPAIPVQNVQVTPFYFSAPLISTQTDLLKRKRLQCKNICTYNYNLSPSS
ncbi:hypothetical protein CDAR_377721 [Caerostris darwini]|uniref:Uncharacterized protein n=1 Tax=Caerostris darwini TaxID=1538125 RepID=A0AAV4WQB7_9ARAC|nr:hypothetical protein CDAR_377721 [Caerostris darwini]